MDVKKYIDSDPSLREVVDMKETAWINPYYLPFHLTDGPLQLVVSDEDIADAEARLQRFAPSSSAASPRPGSATGS